MKLKPSHSSIPSQSWLTTQPYSADSQSQPKAQSTPPHKIPANLLLAAGHGGCTDGCGHKGRWLPGASSSQLLCLDYSKRRDHQADRLDIPQSQLVRRTVLAFIEDVEELERRAAERKDAA